MQIIFSPRNLGQQTIINLFALDSGSTTGIACIPTEETAIVSIARVNCIVIIELISDGHDDSVK